MKQSGGGGGGGGKIDSTVVVSGSSGNSERKFLCFVIMAAALAGRGGVKKEGSLSHVIVWQMTRLCHAYAKAHSVQMERCVQMGGCRWRVNDAQLLYTIAASRGASHHNLSYPII